MQTASFPEVTDDFKRWVLAAPRNSQGTDKLEGEQARARLGPLFPPQHSVVVVDAAQQQLPREDCPLVKAPIWSLILMSWVNSIMKLGNRKVLQETDIWNLPPQDQTPVRAHWGLRSPGLRSRLFLQAVSAKFNAAWAHKVATGGSLLGAFHSAFGTRYEGSLTKSHDLTRRVAWQVVFRRLLPHAGGGVHDRAADVRQEPDGVPQGSGPHRRRVRLGLRAGASLASACFACRALPVPARGLMLNR